MQPTPPLDIPSGGQYLWEWYWQLHNSVGRIFDGICYPIPWSEYRAWADITCTEVYTSEFAVLRAMDVAFCEETNKELQAYRERITNGSNTPPVQ